MMLKHFFFYEFAGFLQLPSWTVFALAYLYILTLNEGRFPFVLTGSVLICELTLGNGCLNRVDLTHCPKSCLLPYIFNGDSHIVPMTHALSHSHLHAYTQTRTSLTEERKQLEA